MRRIALVSAVVLLLLVVAASADTPAQQTFRTDVSLVTIDVTVLDKDGKPVPGLSSEDFEIKLNGKVQPVRAIAFLQAASAESASPGSASASLTAATPAAPAPSAPKPAPMIVAKEVEVRRTINNQDAVLTTAAAPAHPAPAAPAPTSAPGARVAGNIEPRVFVIVIDDLSFPVMRGKALFASAQKFVDTVPASDPVGFTTTSGSMTVNPTMDRAAVKAGLAKAVGEFNDPREIRKGDGENGGKDGPIGMDEAIDIDRGDDTLLMDVIVRECFRGVRNPSLSIQQVLAGIGVGPQQSRCASDVASEAKRTAALMRQQKGRQLAALTGVINAMRTATGIRHLVYVTDGMPVSRDVVDLKPITSVAAAAGVQFSVIMEDPESLNMNAQGRFVPTDGTPQNDIPSKRTREDNKLMLNGAQTFTDVVGGIFYKVIGNADRQFERVLLASSAVYRLGVELPPNTAPGKELSLSADVKRPGLTVRSNRVAINTPAPAPAAAPGGATAGKPAEAVATPITRLPPSVDDLLKAALNENRLLQGVPIRLAATVRRSASAPGQVDVSVNVLLGSPVKAPLTTLIGLVDETNAMRINRRVVDNPQQTVQFLFPVAPGNYAIRFGAADADGALGTIELPIAAKLHTMGTFTTSDLLTYFVGETSQRATLFTTEDLPASAENATYHASIELYPAGATMPAEPPVIAWTIVRDGETKPVFEEETEGRVGASFFRSDIEIPLATLAPGSYTVRATLLVDDKPAGSVGAVIKKK